MKKLLLITAASLFATNLVAAESLEERKYWKGQMDYMQPSIDSAQAKCGYKITFEFTDKAKLRAAAEKAGHTPNGVCGGVVDMVSSLCGEGDDEKASVKGKIKGITCSYAKPRKLDLKNGILSYAGNNEESNFTDWAKPWLMKKL